MLAGCGGIVSQGKVSCFSFIDAQGNSQYEIFPVEGTIGDENSVIPHEIQTPQEVVALARVPKQWWHLRLLS